MYCLRALYESCCGTTSIVANSGTAEISINIGTKTYKTLRLLGEGGFSYVYLCSDSQGCLFALKKIRCAYNETYDLALRELHAYSTFKHPNVIKCIDHTSVDERSGKVVYLLLPYYKRGNLEDLINNNIVSCSLLY